MAFESSSVASQQPPLATSLTPQVTIGSLLSRSFGVWGRNVWKFAGFTMVVVVPVIVLFMILAVMAAVGGSAMGHENALLGLGIAGVAVGIPIALALFAVQMGGLTYGAIQDLAGKQVRFGGMLSAGFGRIIPLIGAGLVVGLCVLLGLALLIVPGVILACGFALTFAVVVAERLGPLDAMKRSWELTRGHRGAYFVAALVLGLFTLAVNLVGNVFGLIPIVGAFISLFIQLVFASLSTVLPAVAYHDLRTQKEGTPTEELARVFE